MKKGWPKGKPRKEPVKEEPFNETVGFSGTGGAELNLDERAELYNNYAKENYGIDPTVTPPDEALVETQVKDEPATTEEPKPEEKVEEKKETVPVAEKTEPAPTAEKVEPVEATEKKPDDIRTVPYGALHEEREKRKGLQREVEDLKSKMNQLIQDNVNLIHKTPKEEETYEPALKSELFALRQEIARLQEKNATVEQRFQADDQERLRERTERLIDEVDKIEADAGRPGFRAIGQHLVRARLTQIAQEDPDLVTAYQTPDGWRKIWAEEFPKVRGHFVQQQTKEILDQKKQAKTGASLVTTPGKSPSQSTPQKEYSWDDYLKERQKVSIL